MQRLRLLHRRKDQRRGSRGGGVRFKRGVERTVGYVVWSTRHSPSMSLENHWQIVGKVTAPLSPTTMCIGMDSLW